MSVIDLHQNREDRNEALLDAVMAHTATKEMSTREMVKLALDQTLGNNLIDDELEEALVIALARAFECKTKNHQHDLNGGYEGNCDEEVSE